MAFRKSAADIVILFLTTAALAVAADSEYSRPSLAGLRGVYILVVVEPPSAKPEVDRAGLTTGAIQTDAELKLRLAGIRVLTRDESLTEPGSPYLHLDALITTGKGPWGYATSVELKQAVRLDRNPTVLILGTTTWSVETLGGYARPSNISEQVRSGLKNGVDQFINAYLSVNPKK
jgi:hypothetical protein